MGNHQRQSGDLTLLAFHWREQAHQWPLPGGTTGSRRGGRISACGRSLSRVAVGTTACGPAAAQPGGAAGWRGRRRPRGIVLRVPVNTETPAPNIGSSTAWATPYQRSRRSVRAIAMPVTIAATAISTVAPAAVTTRAGPYAVSALR